MYPIAGDLKLQGQVEDLGMDVLADEVKDKKRFEIVQRVARGCAIGSQITLIMGGAALLFRYFCLLQCHERSSLLLLLGVMSCICAMYPHNSEDVCLLLVSLFASALPLSGLISADPWHAGSFNDFL